MAMTGVALLEVGQGRIQDCATGGGALATGGILNFGVSWGGGELIYRPPKTHINLSVEAQRAKNV